MRDIRGGESMDPGTPRYELGHRETASDSPYRDRPPKPTN